MLISQTSTDEMLIKIGNKMEELAKEAATRIIEQPHYWRGHPEELQVSKTDLHTDITFEIKKLLIGLFMTGAGITSIERTSK